MLAVLLVLGIFFYVVNTPVCTFSDGQFFGRMYKKLTFHYYIDSTYIRTRLVSLKYFISVLEAITVSCSSSNYLCNQNTIAQEYIMTSPQDYSNIKYTIQCGMFSHMYSGRSRKSGGGDNVAEGHQSPLMERLRGLLYITKHLGPHLLDPPLMYTCLRM